ncbi:uncharacterized protein RAG0_13757 [Rhynchosporium agropyri]|uniref:Uncharacterized protein n=1 Tax=Rhynchosporium agropyri TaxID=914238 RepID=A0A1E1LEE5_9HELO|nr:uncharacterized protein RAG0_13757 [Rhynchosporium agropyri]
MKEKKWSEEKIPKKYSIHITKIDNNPLLCQSCPHRKLRYRNWYFAPYMLLTDSRPIVLETWRLKYDTISCLAKRIYQGLWGQQYKTSNLKIDTPGSRLLPLQSMVDPLLAFRSEPKLNFERSDSPALHVRLHQNEKIIVGASEKASQEEIHERPQSEKSIGVRAALLKFRLRNENSRTAIMDIGYSFQSRAARPEGTISFLKRLIIPSPNAS